MMKAWHFVADRMRDGQPIPPDGEWLEHDGPLVMCSSGFHASKRVTDALQYAPGNIVCRVEVAGTIIYGSDKLVATRRRILWRLDAEYVLRKFARMSALDVVHLWNAPDMVVQYLRTGNEEIRAAAWDDARDAAWAAARDAAWAAAWDDARDAARDAAWDAARAAARAAAWAAAWDDARAAAWAAAWDAARAAAWAAAWDAAKDAARDAARDAAWDAQENRLYRMILRRHP